jgi:hypothetical protein
MIYITVALSRTKALTVYNGCTGGLRREHNCETDDEAFAVGRLGEHFPPGDFIVLVDDILLSDLFKLPESECIAGIVLITMKFPNNCQCLIRVVFRYHCPGVSRLDQLQMAYWLHLHQRGDSGRNNMPIDSSSGGTA